MRLAYRSIRAFGLDHSNLSPNITSQAKRNYTVDCQDPIKGYLTPSSNPHTVIMIHEWWGFNNSIVKTADLFAKTNDNSKQLNVFVPDLYRGAPAKNAEDAEHKMNHLDWGKALGDIKSIKNHFASKGHEVSIMGFCMGGALAFASVASIEGFKAGSAFYGIPDLNLFKVENITAKLIGHFGREDPLKGFSDIEKAKQLQKLCLQKRKSNIKVEVYEGVSHAFCNQDSKYFNSSARDAAFKKTSEFFRN